MKNIFFITTFLSIFLLFAGCKSTQTEAPTSAIEEPVEQKSIPTEQDTVSTEDPEAIKTKLIEKSLLSAGNNYRIKGVIEKARNGEQITIAYLGGSITEGALANPQKTKCYAAVSANNFATRYCTDKSKVTYINAGISGTPSLLGLERCNADILAASPDIVFIEFAVNDNGNDKDLRIAYESIVRKLLKNNPETAVILLFTVLKSGNTAQDPQASIGRFYKLGMISVKNALFPLVSAGSMKYNDYFSPDGVHPSTKGHAMIASFIEHYFEVVDEKELNKIQEIPEDVVFGNTYQDLQNIEIDPSVITDYGDFIESKNAVWTYKKPWIHQASTENKPFVMNMECSNLLIAYQQKSSTDLGNAEVYVDGEKVSELDGYNANAWGNCTAKIAYRSTEKTMHKVEIKMKAGDEAKRFILLGIGY